MVVLEEWQVVLTVRASMADDEAGALTAEIDGLLRAWAEGVAARLDGAVLAVESGGSG